jgi:MFS family permease
MEEHAAAAADAADVAAAPPATVGPVAVARPLLSAAVVSLLVATVSSLGSFYLLLPVVPLYAAAPYLDGAAGVAAGLATGAMMLATVLTELAMPGLLRRFGYRTAFVLGLLLLGAPAAVLPVSPSLGLVLGVCVARGAGLGIVVVTGTALLADLVPLQRHGEGLGIYGLAIGVPAIVCLPLGLWLQLRVGYGPVFAVGAALAVLPVVAVRALPGRPTQFEHPGVRGAAGPLRGGLLRPAIVFGAVTVAAGVLLTFLPLALPVESRQVAAAALLVQSCLAPAARWAAGRYSDQHGGAVLLMPAVVAAALGTAAVARVDSPVAVIVGMGLFGLGYGVAQNVTLTLMLQRVPRSGYSWVSALWNLAFDGGMGIGAVGVGFLTGPAGYPACFTVTAGILCAALVVAWRDRATPPRLAPATTEADPSRDRDG